MRKTGYSSWRFFSSNFFSRALLPFGILLFSNLKYSLTSWQNSGSVQGWLSVGLSLTFFYMFYIQILKKDTSRFSRGDLWVMGILWVTLAIIIQMTILYGIYDQDLFSILQSYSFTHNQPWPYSLVGLLLSPRLAGMISKKWFF
jgi:hypothetical protein